MLISTRAVRILLEAGDRSDLDMATILATVGLDRAQLASDENSVPWSLFVRLIAEVSAAVGDDTARLRAIGHKMVNVPSYAPIRQIARTVMSPAVLYDLAYRWFGRSNFPHLRLLQRIEGDRLMVHGYIPKSYEGSAAFAHLAIGSIVAIPTLLGLPPSEEILVRADDRTLDLELRIPKDKSVMRRARVAVRSIVNRKERAAVLERERQVLDAGLHATMRARDELRIVLERIPALVVIHCEGRILFANRTLAKALGWSSPDDLVGRMLIDFTDPRSRGLLLERMKQAAVAQPSDETTEAWLLSKTGEPVLIEVTPAQAINYEGAPARLVVGRDMAERERLRNQLATADRLAALGLLAAGVAHEVNNPLAYLLNNIEIAQKQLSQLGSGAEIARSALAVATEGAHRIRHIVRELLLLAREEATAGGAADLVETVQSTLALARVEIEKTARLVTELEAVPLIRGSVPRVAQVVLNLVLNALEAMRTNDGSKGELTVRIRRSGERHVLLEIADNGIGVEGKDAARIFLPFFTTKPAGRGTGLGLAVTQRLVTELGGDISFTSEPGLGTTFRVLFPTFEDERVAATRVSSSLPT
jgi:PAS domain S-box-containing protein